MGGDKAPGAILRGALEACSPLGGLRIAPERLVLVGDLPRIESLLAETGGNPGFELRHAGAKFSCLGEPAPHTCSPRACVRLRPADVSPTSDCMLGSATLQCPRDQEAVLEAFDPFVGRTDLRAAAAAAAAGGGQEDRGQRTGGGGRFM